MQKYKIVRSYFRQLSNGRYSRTIMTGLTLEQAKRHCQDPETSWKTCTSSKGRARTRRYGMWFDSFEAE